MAHESKRVLVIAAHPDDEVLGCGGTAARLVQEGRDVYFAIMGEGITSRYPQREQADASQLEQLHRQVHAAAGKLGIGIRPELVVTLTRDTSSPELGYPVVQQLLATGKLFTALVAFNDISAIGAIRALQDANLRVPADVSVIGFDDIKAAGFTLPRLTTIHQPLEQFGRIAGEHLLGRIQGTLGLRQEIAVQPTLVARESTGPLRH